MQQDSVQQLQDKLKQFAVERDWEQFHSPKNLAMALSIEAAELMEHFMWLDLKQSEVLSDEKRQQVAYELADVFIYTLRLAERMGIDLVSSTYEKMAINATKYPAEKVKGSAKKYTEY